MPRLLASLFIIAAGLGAAVVMMAGDPAATVATGAAAPEAGPPVAAPGATAWPRLDPLSVAVGVAGGWLTSKAWRLPWRELPALVRRFLGRSVRAIGLTGLAMIASAIILFY